MRGSGGLGHKKTRKKEKILSALKAKFLTKQKGASGAFSKL
jgi:hypothetical protein